MALKLYRRHRQECEGRRPEDARSGELDSLQGATETETELITFELGFVQTGSIRLPPVGVEVIVAQIFE